MEQIEEAVRCALDPTSDPAVQAQAMEYCEQVKSSADGWQMCLQLFTKTPASSPEARLFALQAIESMIVGVGISASTSEAAANLSAVRQSLLQFVTEQYAGTKYSSEVGFIKNKLAHAITLLALATYPTHWPTFITDMVALTGFPAATGAGVDPSMVDFVIKILGSLDEEMVNPVVPRGKEEVARNTMIKDAMRTEDVHRLAHTWLYTLAHMSATHPDLARGTLRLIGVYVSWIDINLIVNEAFMMLLFELLKTPVLRNDACRCLVEIVSKGMRPMEKLYLIQFLNIVEVMGQLEAGDVDFAENVGKLANATAVELKAIWADKDPATTAEAHATARALIEQLMPLLLRFLSHEYDEVSSAVFPAISDILGVFKRQQKEGAGLSETQQEFLSQLLPALVEKLKYDEGYPWPLPSESHATDNDGSLDEDDDEAMFGELRRNLRVFIDAIGQIAPGLYDSVVLTTAHNIFKQCSQYGISADRAGDADGDGQGQLGWVRGELGVYLTQAYGERLSTIKGLRFSGSKSGAHATNGSSTMASQASTDALAELLTVMIQSGIVNCAHPAIAPTFFENCVRFHGFFDVQREAITPVLAAFIGATGVRHPHKTVCTRIWYLLFRFVKLMNSESLAVYSADVIAAVADLLTIRADVSTISDTAPQGGGYGLFDSQGYLFETCGLMLAPSGLDDSVRMALLQQLFNPLFMGAQQLMNARAPAQIAADPQALLQIHHYLTAIGAIVKGFPDARTDAKGGPTNGQHQLSPSTADVFAKAAEMSIAVLEALRESELIREAARFALSRMLSVLGTAALTYVPRLIDGLVPMCKVEELVDLLGFLGLLLYKFKPDVAPTAAELLLPVISKVYGFLDHVAADGAAGTDESVLLADLRKAYLTWLAAIFNSDLDCVFLTAQNAPHLVTILRPIAAQLAVDSASPQLQRLAFSVLNKTAVAWLVDPKGWHTFVIDAVLPACFEAPTRPGFRLTDAQALLVVTEIAGLLQTLLLAGNQFATYMSTVLLPGLGCPTAMATEFVQALASLNQKQFRKYFVSFLSSNS
ncbi:Xpo1-domain-containing protein [Linderina pennispora]|uniref:Exportin-T n=1 Tax=Linderina pennispora TaxID=61395 RepID=A0A1Y1W579_9FUNG|nr:Xpo1-domain-containing protein [Linderina pennispora]ORX68677.1 Xpo1-domain-containing protein [Linderina pennispora]